VDCEGTRQSGFRRSLVDEAQDSSEGQMRMIDLLVAAGLEKWS